MTRWVFGNNETPTIIEYQKRLYGTLSLKELDQALLLLHSPMDHNQPVEVMILTTEEFQMILMAHPYGDNEIRNVNIISYATIKLSKCGGLYNRATERWKSKTKEYKNIWENFRQYLISEYEKLLSEGVGTTLFQ